MLSIVYENYGVLLLVALLHGFIYLLVKSNSRKKSIHGKHVLVTGGSSGIGLWIAINAAKLGAHVTIIARNEEQLEKAKLLIKSEAKDASQKIESKSLDLLGSYESISAGLADAEERSGPIFMLVNCAGMAVCGTVDDMSIKDARLMMDLNYFGTYMPTKYCLPKMKAAREGIIVITASQAAMIGVYGLGAYSAAKFALRGLAEAISMEVSHLGVSVTLALPVDTDTPGFANEQKSKPEETKLISAGAGLARPEDVGKQILDDALKCSFFSILGLESWLLTILCSGMAPWGNIGLILFSALVSTPVKLIGAGIQWNCRRIVKSCSDNKSKKD